MRLLTHKMALALMFTASAIAVFVTIGIFASLLFETFRFFSKSTVFLIFYLALIGARKRH